ncbi:acetate--CoA ligase family protein [Cupriavidus basilensis]|uniref:Acetyl-CoA synthetase (ADP-forming) alpha and beta chains, putative n=1 Tax=Cupriavidus basilensis TaxID=68895 RepID=A0A0C4YKL6_9BURK|nr:acetate--CoA ligase family protein [Cupriavidus basilensis]AJG23100.1 Acetyl-CoA synthetase (ADP-forming) alpha and beta chains, putative [Cupriavidus basilensis]
MPDRNPLVRLLRPRSVAVIGASDDPLRIGGRPIDYMRSQGYQGRLMPVNPNRAAIQGLEAYASVAGLPQTPDVAIVAVAAKLAPDVVAELAARGTAAAIVFSAGFAEAGAEGARIQQRMVASARKYGMRLLGPNSLGVVNPGTGFYGSFTSVVEMGFPVAGRVGIASQSGAYGSHILGIARDAGIGVSACVMSGNESDISLGDIVHAMVDDDNTDVIAVYAEGIRDGQRLMQALEAARKARKPVVMMKVGTSAVGSAAAQSHTASLAGNDAVTDAVLAEFGVVRARSTEHMLDVARLATRRIYPASNSLGVITVSGGAGVIISDAAEVAGLPMPEMPPATQERLKALLPFAAPRNPVDCTAQFLNDMTIAGRFTQAVVAEGGYQSVLGFFTYTGGADSIAPRLREQLKGVRDKHPDRLYLLSVLASPERVREYEADGFSVFEDPTRAVVAIEAMGRFGQAFERAPGLPPPSVPAVALPDSTPDEAQAKRVLAQAGIAVAPERACAAAGEAVAAAEALGYPVVLKILSPDIQHKSEIGGVLLNVTDAEGVRAGFDLLIARAEEAMPGARFEGVLVAKQLSGGVECILGIQRDPVFGPVAMFGLGGIFVEVMKDVVLHRCPFGEDVAEQMIRSIKGAPLLLGARGKPPVDIKALAGMLARLSVFAHQAGPRLQSVDLNPVFAMPQGQGAFAVDAVIEVTELPR